MTSVTLAMALFSWSPKIPLVVELKLISQPLPTPQDSEGKSLITQQKVQSKKFEIATLQLLPLCLAIITQCCCCGKG